MDINKVCLSIDFGTSNSVMSIYYNNEVIIIKENDNKIIPSVIELSDNKKIIGLEAYNRKKIFDEIDIESINIIYEIKKIIGKKFDELEEEYFEYLGYNLSHDEEGNILINSKFRPEEILTHIFMSFKTIADNFLLDNYKCDEGIKNVIISVPVKFNDVQRKTLLECATNAGFNVLKLLNESTAAAIAYGLNNCKDEKNIIVFDLGAGTLDISYCNIYDNNFEVIGTSGNNNLGGLNFDKKIMEFCVGRFIEMNNLKDDELENMLENINPANMQKLKYLSEQAKISLNENEKTKIKINKFYNDINLEIIITRNDLNELFKVLIQLMIKPLNDLLELCNITKNEIDEIIMVGGMTKFYMVYQNVELFFGKELNNAIDPDLVVSMGNALYGYQILNKEDLNNNLILIDRTSLSLGIETTGGIMDVFIPRNSIMPFKKSKKYTTDSDFLESITIKIYEGDRKMTKDNIHIGDLILHGIEPEKRGIPEIKIEFSIDHYGLIKVKAEDIKNNLNKKSVLINKKMLSKEEVDKIIEKSKLMDNIDRIERTKKQSYSNLINNSFKILDNLKTSELTMPEELKNKLIENITEKLNWLNTKSFDEIDLDTYKELQKDFEIQYSIFLTSQPTTYKVEAQEENIKGVKIYEDEINYSKYTEQINYFKNLLKEYNIIKEHNKKLYDTKFYFLKDLTKDEIINLLTTKNDELLHIVDSILIEIITKPQTDEIIESYCSKAYNLDIEYKNLYNIYSIYFNLIKYVEIKLEEYENSINDENKLNQVIEYYVIIHEMKNNYIEYNETVLMNILLDITI
jgi:molecular chaperone DnaK (HSP70)